MRLLLFLSSPSFLFSSGLLLFLIGHFLSVWGKREKSQFALDQETQNCLLSLTKEWTVLVPKQAYQIALKIVLYWHDEYREGEVKWSEPFLFISLLLPLDQAPTYCCRVKILMELIENGHHYHIPSLIPPQTWVLSASEAWLDVFNVWFWVNVRHRVTECKTCSRQTDCSLQLIWYLDDDDDDDDVGADMYDTAGTVQFSVCMYEMGLWETFIFF